jgi:hypothetical protein
MTQRAQIPTMTDGDYMILDTVEFPQANNLAKVFRVAQIAMAGATSPEEVAGELELVPREGAYYGSAAASLRLVRKKDTSVGIEYHVTEIGRFYATADEERRRQLMIQRTLDCPHVKLVAHQLGLQLPLQVPVPSDLLSRERILEAMAALPEINHVTQRRRASTIAAWMKSVNRLAN